jgi:hypothetical protein
MSCMDVIEMDLTAVNKRQINVVNAQEAVISENNHTFFHSVFLDSPPVSGRCLSPMFPLVVTRGLTCTGISQQC